MRYLKVAGEFIQKIIDAQPYGTWPVLTEVTAFQHYADLSRQDVIGVDHPFFPLARRERQVALLTAIGMKPIGIGAVLGISTKTISTYRERYQRKLGFVADEELTALCLKYEFITINKEFVFGERLDETEISC